MIIKKLPLGNMPTNCYILADEESKECAVFDPADDVEKIIAELDGYNLKYIVLTHMHIDHVMALDKLKQITSAQVVAHKEDALCMNDDNFTLAGFFRTTSPKTKADIIAEDNDIICLGDCELKIIHTPGHTKGSMCIYCDGTLISGDTLFAQSVGRTDFPGGSHSQLVNSIKTKLFSLPDDTKVYSGHSGVTTIGTEKLYNPFL